MTNIPLRGHKSTKARRELATLAVSRPDLDKRALLILPSGPKLTTWGPFALAKGVYRKSDFDEAEAWLADLDVKPQDKAGRRLQRRMDQAIASARAAKRVCRAAIRAR